MTEKLNIIKYGRGGTSQPHKQQWFKIVFKIWGKLPIVILTVAIKVIKKYIQAQTILILFLF